MRKPIITLTTDFGLADHFVGSMKGVILSIVPEAQIVDISHMVPPFAICQAAFQLDQASRCFPKDSVHVAVVDPGVGSQRRALVVEARGQYFVAPDNGILGLVYGPSKPKVRMITAEKYFRKPVSRTFHGRDIFAPVAAYLAKGAPPSQFGPLIEDYVRADFVAPTEAGKGRWLGVVLAVDRFGNLITNFSAEKFARQLEGSFCFRAGRKIARRLVSSYFEGKAGELVVVAASSGYFELATNMGSAAELTRCKAGDQVELVSRS